jgi:hypothetical protein
MKQAKQPKSSAELEVKAGACGRMVQLRDNQKARRQGVTGHGSTWRTIQSSSTDKMHRCTGNAASHRRSSHGHLSGHLLGAVPRRQVQRRVAVLVHLVDQRPVMRQQRPVLHSLREISIASTPALERDKAIEQARASVRALFCTRESVRRVLWKYSMMSCIILVCARPAVHDI